MVNCRTVWAALAAVGLLCVATSSGADSPRRIEWWNKDWSYRQLIRITTTDPAKTINTALAVIDTGGKALRDGRDIRVSDYSGNPVKYQVVDATGGVVKVQFLAASGRAAGASEASEPNLFFIYYGNPTAPAENHVWEKTLGGLTLKIARHNSPSAPRTWQDMLRMVKQNLGEAIGQGPREKIDDSNNPFSGAEAPTAPVVTEKYVGMYKGKLYCPETGTYTFATNSDDSSFLLIDGRLVVSWPGAHDLSATWDHNAPLKLNEGIYDIEYYHVQMTGGVLARAGWRLPSGKAIATIEPRYFVRELRTEVIGLEAADKVLNSFFSLSEEPGIIFNRDPRRFVPVKFFDRSLCDGGNINWWKWDFGDGSRIPARPGDVGQQNPSHEYASAGKYVVTLECGDERGLTDKCRRTVTLGEDTLPERVGLFLDVESDSPVLGPGEALSLRLRTKVDALENIEADLVVEGTAGSGRSILRTREKIVLSKDTWAERPLAVDLKDDSAKFVIRIEYLGVRVTETVVRVLPAAACPDRLALSEKGLTDENGQLVLLRVSGEPPAIPGRRLDLQNAVSLEVVVIDDLLSPSEQTPTDSTSAVRDLTYYGMLARMLSQFYPQLTSVRMHRIDSSIFEEYPALERLGKVPPMVAKMNPDLIILAPGVSDLLGCLPEQKYELYLWATVERLMGCTTAEIVLVTPPPLIVQPEMSKRYAYATKRVAVRLGLPVADAYSAFASRTAEPVSPRSPLRLRRTGGRGDRETWTELYKDPGRAEEVYYIWPTALGQQLIAQRIFSAIVPMKGPALSAIKGPAADDLSDRESQ